MALPVPRTMTARFTGNCAACGCRIKAGKEIAHWARGVVTCSSCSSDVVRVDAARAAGHEEAAGIYERKRARLEAALATREAAPQARTEPHAPGSQADRYLSDPEFADQGNP